MYSLLEEKILFLAVKNGTCTVKELHDALQNPYHKVESSAERVKQRFMFGGEKGVIRVTGFNFGAEYPRSYFFDYADTPMRARTIYGIRFFRYICLLREQGKFNVEVSGKTLIQIMGKRHGNFKFVEEVFNEVRNFSGIALKYRKEFIGGEVVFKIWEV